MFVAVTLIFNIPTGILADKWNRKYTLMLGITALAVSTFIMAHSYSLLTYLFGTAIQALYMTLTSGTFQAITYDLLAENGAEKDYVKHQGRSYGMFLVGISLGSVMGGYIANRYGYRSTYLLSIIPCIVNIVLIATMREPSFHKDVEDTKLWPHVRKTVKLLTGERLLFYLSLLFVGASLLNGQQNEYAGLYYIALGFGAVGNGWANAGKWLSGSIGQFLTQKLGKHTRILIPLFFITFLAFTIFRSPFGLIFFYLAAFSQAIVATNIEGVIQSNTPSSVRATMLSVLGFATDVLLIPTSLVFGYIARHNVFNAYAFIAILGIIFAIIWYLRPKTIKRHKLYTPRSSQPSLEPPIVSA